MIEPPSERGKRLSAVSQRLRVLHAELADQPVEVRSEQLRDEVQRAIAAMAPSDREGFLKDLMFQFPTWSTDGGGAAPVHKSVEVKDPLVLSQKLIEACKGLSAEEREEITHRLVAAGLGGKPSPAMGHAPAPRAAPTPVHAPAAPVAAPVDPGAAGAELRRHLGVLPDASLDTARIVETAAALAEFTLKVEHWSCTFWRTIAPGAKNPVPQVLNKDLARFVSGEEKMDRDAVAKSLLRLRSLVSLLMKGVTEAGKQYARDHMARYGVPEIEKTAGPSSLLESRDVKCWKQYVRQMEGVDAASLEKRLLELVAKDVDAGLGQVLAR